MFFFMGFPNKLISSTQTRSWCVPFNSNQSLFPWIFIMVYPKANFIALFTNNISKHKKYLILCIGTFLIRTNRNLGKPLSWLKNSPLLCMLSHCQLRSECYSFGQLTYHTAETNDHSLWMTFVDRESTNKNVVMGVSQLITFSYR
jgi:hypothetical protein